MKTREWQFDGLVGPTHNYAGLATGNMASAYNAGAVSNPRQAAIQGLEKMRFVRDLGMAQGVFPPHYRPLVSELKRLGFSGSLGKILDDVYRVAPELLAAVFSSSFMWAANAATVTPSADTHNGRLHFTPANLISHYHRSIETIVHWRNLKEIFRNESLFEIHNALPSADQFGDEGAANHMRVIGNSDNFGVNIFVYGRNHELTFKNIKFLPRQQRYASESISRSHGLTNSNSIFFMQSPEAISLGVFHNDVIALNTGSRMIIHRDALIPEHQKQLCDLFAEHPDWRLYEVDAGTLSIEDAVATYFFNSQLLTLPSGRYALVAPSECMNHAASSGLVEQLLSEGVLDEAHYLDVRESMRNGGGPACLRLRIVTTPEQDEFIHPGVILDDRLYQSLLTWIHRSYRDRLSFDDFRDPNFIKELDAAYGALEAIVALPGLYDSYRL